MARGGYLIAFEGLDGCGKDSQIKALCSYFDQKKIRYRVVNQLETEAGNVIRKKYLSGEVKNADEKVIDLLFAADRLEYLQSWVKEYLEEGFVVILNRYLLSALAYGCYKTSLLSYDGNKFTYDHDYYDWLREINWTAFKEFWPDLTIFLDIAPKTSVERVGKRGNKTEIYEDPRKQTYIHKMFIHSIIAESARKMNSIVSINGEFPIDEVSIEVRKVINERCPY